MRTETPVSDVPLFESFMVGGFECSTHRIRSGRRLDLIAATGHDRHVRADYQRLRTAGIHTAREGMRWHLIEPSPWRYTFASLLPIVHAVEQIGIQVIWDLCHCGWPKDIDLFDGAFVERVAAYARAVTRLLQAESGRTPVIAPVNEISFFAWAAGQVGYFHPFATE